LLFFSLNNLFDCFSSIFSIASHHSAEIQEATGDCGGDAEPYVSPRGPQAHLHKLRVALFDE
jgi:hypothetical protein